MSTSTQSAPQQAQSPSISSAANFYFQLPRTIHILCVGTFINRAGGFVMLFLTVYVSEVLGLGKTFASYCIGAFGMGAVVSSFVGGHLADKFGRRMTMLIALFGGAAVLILQSRITNGWIFMAGMFMFAMILDMYRPATSAMISDLTKPEERPHAFGLMYIAMNLGFAIAPPIGGFLAERSFQWLFWGDAITTALYGVVILLFVSESKPRVDRQGRISELPSMESPANPYEPPLAELAAIDEADRTGTTLDVSKTKAASAKSDAQQITFRGGLAHMRKDGIFLMYCVCSLLTSIVFMQAFVTLPLYLLGKGFSKSEFGSMICVNGIVIVLFQLPLTHFLRRFSRTKIVLCGELLLAAGFGLTVFADSAVFIVATIVIWTFGEIFQAPYKSAIVAEMASVALRARYMGMFNLSHSLSLMLGAPLGGFILDRFGPGVLWPGCCVLLTGTTLCYAWILKRHAESNRLN